MHYQKRGVMSSEWNKEKLLQNMPIGDLGIDFDYATEMREKIMLKIR